MQFSLGHIKSIVSIISREKSFAGKRRRPFPLHRQPFGPFRHGYPFLRRMYELMLLLLLLPPHGVRRRRLKNRGQKKNNHSGNRALARDGNLAWPMQMKHVKRSLTEYHAQRNVGRHATKVFFLFFSRDKRLAIFLCFVWKNLKALIDFLRIR